MSWKRKSEGKNENTILIICTSRNIYEKSVCLFITLSTIAQPGPVARIVQCYRWMVWIHCVCSMYYYFQQNRYQLNKKKTIPTAIVRASEIFGLGSEFLLSHPAPALSFSTPRPSSRSLVYLPVSRYGLKQNGRTSWG